MSHGEFKNAKKYFAFYSQFQIDTETCLNSRKRKVYEHNYQTWKDRVHDRIILLLEWKEPAYKDIILEYIYKNKPQEYVEINYINKQFKRVDVTDVYSCCSNKNLDKLIKSLKLSLPDIIYKGVVVKEDDDKIIWNNVRKLSF